MCFAELYIVLFSVKWGRSEDVVKRHIHFGCEGNIQIPCSSVLLIVFFTGGSSITMRIVKFLKIRFSKTMQCRE